jgi:DNA-binding transcriptional LysR family regulator
MLDFELLRAFVAVADCGGFHRAGDAVDHQPRVGARCRAHARQHDVGPSRKELLRSFR